MKNMMLIDFNGIAIGSLMAVTKKQSDVNEDLIRHLIINSIIGYKKKFDCDEIIICADARSWRRDIFPHYKAARQKGRESSPYDWPKVFNLFNTVLDEINNHLPWKVIFVTGAEADDIIGHLTYKYGQTTPITIISADKDFIQLHNIGNIKQWSPMQKKFVKHADPAAYLKEHIIRGDSGDGIPNILSSDDTFVTNKRQTPMRKKYIEAWMEQKPEDFLTTAEMADRWTMNKKMIDLKCTPTDIRAEIDKQYDEYEGETGRSKIFNYFTKKRLRNLMADIQSV